MSKSIEVAKEAIKKNCNPIEISDDFNQLQISISTNQILDVVDFIKNDEACEFRQITDIAGVDFPDRQKRFELIYHFLSFKHNSRLRIKIIIGEDEAASNSATIKDLIAGKKVSNKISDNQEWRSGKDTQKTVPIDDLISNVKSIHSE